MRKFRSLIVIIPAFYLYYASIAVFGGILSDKYEYFPFFNWSLFSYVSDIRHLCELEIISINGRVLDPPANFYALPQDFEAARTKDSTVLKLLQKIANAKAAGDQQRFEELREVLDHTYLSSRSDVVYRLVVNEYHPIERWRDGSIRSTVALGRFRAGKAER